MTRHILVEAHLSTVREWISQLLPADLHDDTYERYEAGYLAKYRAWLGAMSRTLSPMVTGPSNFPTRRNQKHMSTADRRLRDLQAYVIRARRGIVRQAREIAKPDDPTAALRAEIAQHIKTRDAMKAVNKVLRTKRTDAEKVAAIVSLGFREATAHRAMQPDFCGRVGFPGYELTSIAGKIKRAEAKLAALEGASVARDGDGWAIEEDPKADRLRIVFDEKPELSTIQRLRASGFRWSPTNHAWQRELTANARAAALALLT